MGRGRGPSARGGGHGCRCGRRAGDHAVRAAPGRLGVVDGDQGGHPLAPWLLTGRQPVKRHSRRSQRSGIVVPAWRSVHPKLFV
jgi:hypothetical protein